MISKNLINAIRQAWDENTCYPLVQSSWNSKVPELGQCAVTALLIQEKYGGKIFYNRQFDHYWNVLPNGKKIDLTKGQFSNRVVGPAAPVKRDTILKSYYAKKFKTNKRYKLLKERVESRVSV